MDTITVIILDPDVVTDLNTMENQKRIRIEKTNGSVRKPRKFGSMKGLVVHMADDFNSPIEDFNQSKKGPRKSRSARRAFYLSAPRMTVEERARHKEIKQWMNRWR